MYVLESNCFEKVVHGFLLLRVFSLYVGSVNMMSLTYSGENPEQSSSNTERHFLIFLKRKNKVCFQKWLQVRGWLQLCGAEVKKLRDGIDFVSGKANGKHSVCIMDKSDTVHLCHRAPLTRL